MADSIGRLLIFSVLVLFFVPNLPPWFGVEIASRFLGTVVSIGIAYVVSGYLVPNGRLEVLDKAVLVTGCDTGESSKSENRSRS